LAPRSAQTIAPMSQRLRRLVLVEVEWKGPNHWTLSCVQYYARDGVCQLEITQSLNRALQTFAAILAAAAELEGGEIHMSHH
jgi:hypothetical protein